MSNFSAGMAAWKLTFQLSPIILVDGVTANLGGMLPVIAITEALNFLDGVLSGGENIELDHFFANYQVISGGTIIDQQIGHYPFANQAVAANAVISQPLKVSMMMFCPVQYRLGYALKLSTMLSLQSVLKQHNALGGTYTVMTPSAFYANCVMLNLTDISNSESKQVQNTWRWDFEQPLLTQADAKQAYNSAMGKIAGQVRTDGALSGLNTTINSPFTAMTPAFITSAKNLLGAQTAIAPGIGL